MKLAKWSRFLLLLAIYACGLTENPRANLTQVIDDALVNIYAFDNSNEQDPELNSKTLIPIVEITETDGTIRGYRIDCPATQYNHILAGFGYGDIPLNVLERIGIKDPRYEAMHVEKQVILSCAALAKDKLKEQIAAVYAVVDRPANDTNTALYYLKFKDRPEELYSVGCKNFFDAFNWDHMKESIPITTESVRELLSNKNTSIKQINCVSSKGIPLEARTQISQWSWHDVNFDQSKIYKLTDDGTFNKQGLPPLFPYVISNGIGFPIGCGPNSHLMMKAFGFANVDVSDLPPMDLSSDVYKNSQPGKQPVLQCKDKDPKNPRVKSVYTLKNLTPLSTYIRFENNPNTLVRLGCPELRKQLGVDAIKPILITYESLEHLIPGAPKGIQHLVDLSCKRNGPSPDEVSRAFLAVFGVSMNSDWAAKVAKELTATGKPYPFNAIVDYWVNGMASSEAEVKNITSRAFSVTRQRAPTNFEEAFFIKRILQEKQLRPHHDELVGYLKRIHELPYDQLNASYMEAMGEVFQEGIQWWVEEFFSHPDKDYSYGYVLQEHINYNFKDEGGWGETPIRHLIKKAFRDAVHFEIGASALNQYVDLIRNRHAVRPHYRELVDFIHSRNNIPGDQPRVDDVPDSKFVFVNRCSDELDVSLRGYDTDKSWKTLNQKLAPNTQTSIAVASRFVYWNAKFPDGSSNWQKSPLTNVYVRFSTGWEQGRELYIGSSNAHITFTYTVCGG